MSIAAKRVMMIALVVVAVFLVAQLLVFVAAQFESPDGGAGTDRSPSSSSQPAR